MLHPPAPHRPGRWWRAIKHLAKGSLTGQLDEIRQFVDGIGWSYILDFLKDIPGVNEWPLTIRIGAALKEDNKLLRLTAFPSAFLQQQLSMGRPMQPKKSSLTTLSNEALCKLRDEIAALLNSRAKDLRRELDRLAAGGTGSKAECKKAAPKYRGPDGDTWAGRGLKPRWLTSALQEGKKLEDFLIVAPKQPLHS
jgi:DNA-binding protein H-NS